jgi:deazaflavin-dependent oxidoreductase (nitroreductase family)
MTEAPPVFIKPTRVERWINALVAGMVGWGIGFADNYLLQVRGRASGRTYSMAVNVLTLADRRFLVATRGETQWVRNVRQDGKVWLKKGRRKEMFQVRTVRNEEKPGILKAYVDRFRFTVQRFFAVRAGESEEKFKAIADRYPVFELISER